MKIIGILLVIFGSFSSLTSQNLNPYILAFETTLSIDQVKETVQKNLEQNGIDVVGKYRPAGDNNRWIIIFTSPELINAVQAVGGLTGFATTLRIGITREGNKTMVSYTNPIYWGTAYFRYDYEKVSSNYTMLSTKLVKAMRASGTFQGIPFGSEDGHSSKTLKKYHYMIGMPYFENTVELGQFDSHSAAVSKVDNAIKTGVQNLEKVYRVKIPGKDLVLYGFGLSGESGESQFMPIIDIGQPKHTAFLPYEILIMGGEVHMLHGRYRIALSFPDLTMATFSKIMSTPGNIEELLEQVVQ